MNTNTFPEHLRIDGLLKATPVTEGAERFVYIEASSEARDQQGEIVLSKALADSAAYFLKFGNLDIDHYTQIGASRGIPNYPLFEIGRPVDVSVNNGRTMVKGHIHSGDGLAAEKANDFWSSLTDIKPPARWYASVLGSVPAGARKEVFDPSINQSVTHITSVVWRNVGFSKTPVNADLLTVSTLPIEGMSKAYDCDLAKALEAGACSSDTSTLEGGGALGQQSLLGGKYKKKRNKFAPVFNELRKAGALSEPALVHAAQQSFDCSYDDATRFVGKFLNDISRDTRGK